MIMNGQTPKSLSTSGGLAVLALSLLLPLAPIQAQAPQDPKDPDPRDQQIENLKKMIRALEDQQRAEKNVHRAAAEQAERAAALQQRVDAVRALRLQEEAHAKVADELKKIDQEKHLADEQQLRALHAVQQAQLAQGQDPEQPHEIRRLRVEDQNPDLQRAERAIEEITKMMEVKRQELQALEQKLRAARAELDKMRVEDTQRKVKTLIELRKTETRLQPLIIKVDPSVNWEQVKKQLEEIQANSKQPVHVEIVRPNEPGRQPKEAGRELRFRTTEPSRDPRGAKESRPVERRDDRGSDLEQKLDRIMKEVEELRRELHSGSRK